MSVSNSAVKRKVMSQSVQSSEQKLNPNRLRGWGVSCKPTEGLSRRMLLAEAGRGWKQSIGELEKRHENQWAGSCRCNWTIGLGSIRSPQAMVGDSGLNSSMSHPWIQNLSFSV